MFFEKWNDTEKPKKNPRKESWQRTSGTSKWDKLGQVGVVGQVGQGEGGLQILVGQVEQGEWGLQIFVGQVGQGQGVCPLEPFHLSQLGLHGRDFLIGDDNDTDHSLTLSLELFYPPVTLSITL